LARKFTLKRIPVSEELIPVPANRQLIRTPSPPVEKTLAQFWDEVKETTGVTEPMTQDEFTIHNQKGREIESQNLLGLFLGKVHHPDLIKQLFPELLPRVTTFLKQQAELIPHYAEGRQLATAIKALNQHIKTIKKAMMFNQREANPALKLNREKRLQQSLSHAFRLKEQTNFKHAFRANWLPEELELNIVQNTENLPSVFGRNPLAMQKVREILTIHQIVSKNMKKMHLKVETLSALQSDIAEAASYQERKALKNKFRKKTAELKTLMEQNSELVQKAKSKRTKRKLGPRFFARFDSFKDTGTMPLTILAKRALRLGQTETINTLLNAGADRDVVADELLRWKLGFPTPPRADAPGRLG
jgi:hypothetical protein